MSKVMLVNVTHVEESRVAVVDGGVLETYEIETTNRANLRGNIFNAIVESVHASLDAAFLRLSPDLKGFLPLDEVNFKLLPQRTDNRKNGRIGQHLHPGQRLMAQVVREPFAGKPPTVSTYFSLPGRYLVLMPGVDAAGVSRKIEDPSQRERLRALAEELRPPEGFGLIVRTAGLGQTKAELQRDMRYLLRLWESIQRASRATEFPGLVYQETDLVTRTIRDHFTPDIAEVWIDSAEAHGRALQFMRDVMPTKAKTVQLYTGDRPLFNKFNIEEQIEAIYKRRVPLTSGGEIVIDGTEALTAIDVNSARSRRQGDADDLVLQTNLEAAAEIVKQLRLRDLGGLIVIDFIDMYSERAKSTVEKAVRDAIKNDKARSDVTRISKLGLMEIARQRMRGEKIAASYATCPACDGHGLIKNVEAAALAALRKLQARTSRGDVAKLTVGLPTEVATWMLNHKREELVRTEQRQGLRIEIQINPALRRHESTFEAVAREKGEIFVPPPLPVVALPVARPVEPADELEPELEEQPEVESTPADATATPSADPAGPATPPGDAAAAELRGRRRRRRRRGRGGRGGQTPTQPETLDAGATPDPVPPAMFQGPDSHADIEPDLPPDIAVPRGVRGDELMPAAVGAAGEGGRGARGGRRRRRGGRGPRGSGPAGGAA